MNERFININFVNWEQQITKGLWLVDFWADWCTACQAQDRIYEEIADQFGDKISIGKVDVSDNRLLSQQFGIQNIPFLILLKDGEVKTKMPGVQSKEYLINQIKIQIS
jgi:thioredoxin 1